jgi:hypothetical protein
VFPISEYDRGTLALSNLLDANLGGAARAMFTPMELSPQETKTLREKLLRGKNKDNAVLQTALDLATNPLVIAGLVMALGPWGKVGSPKHIAALMEEGGKYIKDINPLMRGLSSPLTSMRNLWKYGVKDLFLGITTKTSEFAGRHGEEWGKLIRDFQTSVGRNITQREGAMLAAWLEEFHKAPLAKTFTKEGKKVVGYVGAPLQASYHRLFGTDTALAPNLEKIMRKEGGEELMKLAHKARRLVDKSFHEVAILDDDGTLSEEFFRKGVEYIRGYYPHNIMRSGVADWATEGSLRSLSDVYRSGLKDTFKKATEMMGKKEPMAHMMPRKGGSLPWQPDLDLIKDAFDPVQWQKIVNIENHRVEAVRDALVNLSENIPKVIARGESREKAAQIMWDHLKAVLPDLPAQLSSEGYKDQFLKRLLNYIIDMGKNNPEKIETLTYNIARNIGAPARYRLDAVEGIGSYIKAVAPGYGWRAEGMGKKLDAIFANELGVLDDQKRMYVESLRPMLKGFMDPREFARRAWFNDVRAKARMFLTESPFSQKLPESTRQWLDAKLSGARGAWSESTIGGAIASNFYSAALGLNLSPISKNLGQNAITTLQITGPGNMARGLGEVTRRLSRMKSFTREGLEKAFSEYTEHFGHEHIAEAMAAGDITKETVGISLKGAWNMTKKGMMLPFAGSEKFNRLLSFYSFREAALADGLEAAKAGKFARDMTHFTMFPGGVLGQPNWLRGRWAPLRQFLHFPSRFAEYLYGSLRMGPDPEKISLGIMGRTLAGSAGIYTIARNMLGMDYAGGLAMGALPGPGYEGSAFYPMPFVPPVLSVLGEGVKAVHSGDYGKMGNVAALMMPGGLAARKAYSSLAPKYVGYRERGPDGKYPVYNKEGSLISRRSPMELTMTSLGLTPSNVRQEQEFTQYLLRQRDLIRQYRKEYLEAVYENDMDRAGKIKQDWAKKFPDLGEMQVSKGDLKALITKRKQSRIERVLQGFPQSVRPIYERLIAEGMGQEAGQQIDNYLVNYEPGRSEFPQLTFSF